MDSKTLVNETSRKLNGEFEDIEVGSDDWNTIVSALNENIDLYNKSGQWRTMYDPRYEVGTVTDDEFYSLNYSEINEISGSNRAHILFYNDTNVIVGRYKLVNQDIFDNAGVNEEVATINMNGLQIKPQANTSRIYGATIVLPVFRSVGKIVRQTDKPKINDIYWLTTKTAADLASTSPVDFIARNFDTLNAQAEKRMKDMKKENRITQTSTPAVGNWCPSTRPDGR